jgi:LPXTG-motif cell wall-anchored protein
MGVVAAGLAVLATPAHAQAAPTGGIAIDKIEVGGTAPASFTVTGIDVQFNATVVANVVAENTPTPALPALPPLENGTYQIQEIAPIDQNGQSAWDLTSIVCDGGNQQDVGFGIVQVTVDDELITCTFTDELTRATILGLKLVTGNTSTWTRPAQFHITCPEFQLDIDIEPPVGPGGPGTYTIGQGSLPPATCTITETDTGSDAPVIVASFVTNHGILIAAGANAVTFTSAAGDELVVTFSNQFPPIGAGEPTQPRERPEQGSGATTTTATGGSTTTTTTVPGGGTTTTVPGGGATTTPTTTPGGGATTTASAPATAAPTTAPQELPTTGDSAGTLIAAALGIMVLGLTLIARTRRFLD